mgnify:CR=1 FL=1
MITIIAAVGNNNELGKDNDLIWYLPADLKRFKKRTTGHAIIMGRNTFESIGKPLPNRRTIIITRDTSYQKEGCEIVHSLEDAIALIADREDAFIIGGAQIYKEAMEKNLVYQLDITKVYQDFDADVFFPPIDPLVWAEVSRENFLPDEKNLFTYSFIKYRRAI